MPEASGLDSGGGSLFANGDGGSSAARTFSSEASERSALKMDALLSEDPEVGDGKTISWTTGIPGGEDSGLTAGGSGGTGAVEEATGGAADGVAGAGAGTAANMLVALSLLWSSAEGVLSSDPGERSAAGSYPISFISCAGNRL